MSTMTIQLLAAHTTDGASVWHPKNLWRRCIKSNLDLWIRLGIWCALAAVLAWGCVIAQPRHEHRAAQESSVSLPSDWDTRLLHDVMR